MEFSIVCDTYLSEIIILRNELDEVCAKVNEKYRDVHQPNDLIICFRCLPKEIGRKSFRRYDRTDNTLTVDITTNYEYFLQINQEQRRKELGKTFYNYLESSLNKYKFSDLESMNFLMDIKSWCSEVGWLIES